MRRPRGHDRALLDGGRRLRGRAGRNCHARRDGLHVERAADRRELANLGLLDSPRPLVVPEAIGRDADHGIVDGHVPVDVDVGHVDRRRPVDHHVVDHVRTAPAAPRGDADESGTPPPRNDGLAPGERGPAKRANAHPHAAAEEHDEGRRVHGPDDYGPRRPRPVAADEDPAPVMIGRPAPGSVVEPRPPEARIPDPAAGAVRHPARRRACGHPHRSVLLNGAPAAVLVQLLGAVRTARHVASARGADDVVGALGVPAIPRAQRRRRARLDARRFGAGDHDLLVAGDLCRLAPRGGHRGDATAVRPERRRIRLHVRAIEPHALDREDGVGSIELDGLAGRKLTKVESGQSARQPELEKIGLLVVETDLGSLGGSNERARADLDLDVAVRTRVENVTGCQGRVDLRRGPVVGARPPEGHLASDVADAGRDDLGRLRLRGRVARSRRSGGLPGSGLSVRSSPRGSRRSGQHAQREKPCNDLP